MNPIDTLAAIQALDLTPIKSKLMHAKFGEGWSQSKVNAMEIEYQRFLFLQATFPDQQTAPTQDVDTFWHYHILDTVKYASDCERAFGYFLHHRPDATPTEDSAAGPELEAGNRTRALYEATFDEAYIRAEAYGENGAGYAAARCQGPCIAATPMANASSSAACQAMNVFPSALVCTTANRNAAARS